MKFSYVAMPTSERQVRFWVGAEDLTAVFSFVGQSDDDLIRPLDDMKVGEHEPALVDDDAGAEPGQAILRAGGRGAFGAEELVEEVLEERVVGAGGDTGSTLPLRALDRAEMQH